MKRFITDGSRVLVAVNFDDECSSVVRVGKQIADRLGKGITLFHVVEPWLRGFSKPLPPDHSPLWDVSQAVEQSAAAQAKDALETIAADIGGDVQCRVFTGKVTDWIEAEATAHNSSLIVCGLGKAAKPFMPTALSTALKLIDHGTVPVLIVGSAKQGAKPAISDEPQVVLADDLSPTSDGAISCAFELANALRKTKVHHLHVTNLTKEELKSGVELAQLTSHQVQGTSRIGDMDLDALYDSVSADFGRQLQQRSAETLEYLEASGGHYAPVVLAGRVDDELQNYTAEVQPDIVVFGRHRTLHRDPISWGQMPFRSMLQVGAHVLVAPEETEETGDA